MMMKGFLSFVLASVFLLAIVAAAMRISSVAPDHSYENYRYMQLQELAVKKAFYASTADAAKAGLADAIAANTANGCYETGIGCVDEKGNVEKFAYENVPKFEHDLRQRGTDAVFWCGATDSDSLRAASEGMQNGPDPHAIKPEGTSGISDPCCRQFFEAYMASMRLDLSSPNPGSNIGFSIYSQESGIGYAAVFPNKKGVSFA